MQSMTIKRAKNVGVHENALHLGDHGSSYEPHSRLFVEALICFNASSPYFKILALESALLFQAREPVRRG